MCGPNNCSSSHFITTWWNNRAQEVNLFHVVGSDNVWGWGFGQHLAISPKKAFALRTKRSCMTSLSASGLGIKQRKIELHQILREWDWVNFCHGISLFGGLCERVNLDNKNKLDFITIQNFMKKDCYRDLKCFFHINNVWLMLREFSNSTSENEANKIRIWKRRHRYVMHWYDIINSDVTHGE